MSEALVYAISNGKGGSGKSTTALCLVEALHARGKRALLVDLDQQCNATCQFGAHVDGRATVYDLLTDEGADVREAVQATPHGDIIAGDKLLAKAEAEMASMTCRETRLADHLEELRGEYDYIVIDCSPFLGIATTNAFVAADKVIVPIDCGKYAIDGAANALELAAHVAAHKRLNPNLQVAGLLLTIVDARQALDRALVEQLPNVARAYGTKAYATHIRRCCKTAKAQQLGVSLYDYAPECTTARDYAALVDEIEAGE